MVGFVECLLAMSLFLWLWVLFLIFGFITFFGGIAICFVNFLD